MLTIENLRDIRPLSTPRSTAMCARGAQAFLACSPMTVTMDGLEHLPAGPAIFSPNHTHKFDFLPIRSALFKTHRLITWVKARDYSDPILRTFFNAAGNVPIVSRGFVISADFIKQFGRRPTEDEYRVLRNHVDRGDPLPDVRRFQTLQNKKRDLSGRPFNPSSESYRVAVQSTYYAFMQATLTHARTIRDAGCHQHIYPEGAVSQKLTPGKHGAVQAAIALDIPIVPVGISGCTESFIKETPFARGEIRIKFGAPIWVDSPGDAKPFWHTWENENHAFLQTQTEHLMSNIHDLVDLQYGWAKETPADAKTGIARFI